MDNHKQIESIISDIFEKKSAKKAVFKELLLRTTQEDNARMAIEGLQIASGNHLDILENNCE